jgi:hypothetical protein
MSYIISWLIPQAWKISAYLDTEDRVQVSHCLV